MLNGTVVGSALMKTGSLEGVRALAGYVLDARGARWIVVALVNHPNAGRAVQPLDFLAEWVRRNADAYVPPRR
jgi:D-alanyl-D-alanine carboxypeptidase/D-alanyl-D-alanine-endopeptidase (penicillin-binding protein 4)